jgi:hypothetical protein
VPAVRLALVHLTRVHQQTATCTAGIEAEVAYCEALNPHEPVPTAAVGTATRDRCANHATAEIILWSFVRDLRALVFAVVTERVGETV